MSINSEYIGNELELFAHAKNWKRYWSSKIRPMLRAPVLEVGAGIGSNLALLRTENINWTALEPDSSQATKIANGRSDNNLEVISAYLNDLDGDKTFQTIIYIDVLEHIENDLEEVKLAANRLKAGGRLIVLAPAHNRLFSPFDNAVGHFRRYDKRMLQALTPPELRVESLYYLDAVGCLASFANALLLRSDMPTARQIWLWDRCMVPISRILDKLALYKLGKTIVMVWEKPTNAHSPLTDS